MTDEAEATGSEEPSEAEPAKKVKPPKPAKAPKPPKAVKEKTDKKGGFPWVLVLIPVALVAALVLAFCLPPTHAMLVKSPLGPLLARLGGPPAKMAGKGKGAAAASADPAADVKRLNDALVADRAAAVQKDAQIAQLQAQMAKGAAAPASAATPLAKPTATAVPDDVKRAAAYWAGMDADKAAEIIKQLPDGYVKGVFAQMPADAVADIMSAMPAKTAARLTTSSGADSP